MSMGTDTAQIGRRAQGGFTFVEMLIVVIVVGLLAALMIPAFLGQREKAQGASAESLLRNGASTIEAASVDSDGYALITTATLQDAEPNVVWMDAAGAVATEDQVSVTGLGPNGYTLTTTSAAGTVYTLAKDLTSSPTIQRSCGPGCSW